MPDKPAVAGGVESDQLNGGRTTPVSVRVSPIEKIGGEMPQVLQPGSDTVLPGTGGTGSGAATA